MAFRLGHFYLPSALWCLLSTPEACLITNMLLKIDQNTECTGELWACCFFAPEPRTSLLNMNRPSHSHLYFLSRLWTYKNTSFLTQMGSSKFFPCISRYKGHSHHKTKKKKKKINISHYSTFPQSLDCKEASIVTALCAYRLKIIAIFPKKWIKIQNIYFLYCCFNKAILSRGAVAMCQHIWISLPEFFNSDSHISLPFRVFFHFWKQILLHSWSFTTTTNCVLFKYHSSCYSSG